MIKRAIKLENLIKKGKVLIIYGARRVGKTTILEDFLSGTNLKFNYVSGDNIRIQQVLSSQDFTLIKDFAAGYELIAIDEAQYIPNIGMGLKIMVDQFPDLYIVATGSSSFDLSQQTGEPLTGRKRTIILYPFSQMELSDLYNRFELKEKLEEFLIFGCYPEVVTVKSKKEKKEIITELVNSYLLKDVFALEKIKGTRQLLDLLKLLSFQVSNEVSLNELASQVRLDIKTVSRYLDILEKGFVIKSIGGFSRNLRKEIVSKSKYYFLDCGIRNGIINQFNLLKDRDDRGRLFENFLIMERIKRNNYLHNFASYYFWRTYDQKEIDFVEESEGKLFAFEFKWLETKRIKAPNDWTKNYPDSVFNIIDSNNYFEFIL
jgi:uncharacterized protein